MKFLSTLGIIILSMAGSPASAASDLSVGSIHKGSLALDYVTKRLIPLPAGNWEILQSVENRNNINNVSRRIFLGKIEDKKLVAGIDISFPEDSGSNGYVRDRRCDRTNLHFNKTRDNWVGREQDCYIVNHWRVTLQGHKSNLVNEVGDKLIERGVSWPNHLMTVRFRFADSSEYLNVMYQVAPAAFGFEKFKRTTWASSPWHPHATANYPERQSFVKTFIDWSKSIYPLMKRSWEGDLKDDEALPNIEFVHPNKNPA